MKTGTHTQVPVPMTIQCRTKLKCHTNIRLQKII